MADAWLTGSAVTSVTCPSAPARSSSGFKASCVKWCCWLQNNSRCPLTYAARTTTVKSSTAYLSPRAGCQGQETAAAAAIGSLARQYVRHFPWLQSTKLRTSVLDAFVSRSARHWNRTCAAPSLTGWYVLLRWQFAVTWREADPFRCASDWVQCYAIWANSSYCELTCVTRDWAQQVYVANVGNGHLTHLKSFVSAWCMQDFCKTGSFSYLFLQILCRFWVIATPSNVNVKLITNAAHRT